MDDTTELDKTRWGGIIPFLSVTVLINLASPMILRSYASRFHGHPVIPMTDFVLRDYPFLLITISLFIAIGLWIARGSKTHNVISKILITMTIFATVVYLFGVSLPFLTYPIGLD